MKKIILSLIIFSATVSIAQTKDKDYSKLNTKELIDIIKSKDKEINSFKERLEKDKSTKDKLESEKYNSISVKITELKKSIKETNAVFLREIFDNKYVNKPYLMETDLANEDITTRIENSNVLIKSILLDDTNKDVFEICNNALIFNQNYLGLFEIRKNVLYQKYDVQKINQAIKEIDKLPAIEVNSKLDSSKKKIRNYLENYKDRTCELKIILEKLKSNPDQNPTFKQQYTKLENKTEYKDYPYLTQIIRKIKNNKNDYSKDDLQPCDEVKEKASKTNEDDKSLKENQPVKALKDR